MRAREPESAPPPGGPNLGGPEASETYRVSRAILSAGSAVVGVLLLTSPWLSARPLHAGLGYALLLAIHLTHLLWVHKGRADRAVKSFCFSYFVAVTAIEVEFGGIRSPIGFAYLPLVLFCGLLWSGRAALGFAFLCSAAGLVFVWLERRGVLVGLASVPPPERAWSVMTGALIVTALILHVGLRALQRSKREALALRERLDEAERLEALGRLAGGIAHDFNNQLTAVLGHVELLRRFPPDRHELSLEAIEHAALHAAELTRGLLQFGRRQALAPSRHDAREAISSVERLLRPSLGAGVSLEVKLPDTPLWVLVDRVALERALVNLITNARDALPNGGLVSVSGELQSGADAPELVKIEVRDTGVGMDEATRMRIFEPFFTTKGRTKGSGLGLASVHGIVAQSGGTIDVTSRLGWGTVFRLSFPGNPQAPALTGSEPRPSRPPRSSSDTRMLLVEDEQQVRRVMQTALVGAGYDVTTAGGVQEALLLCAVRPQPFELLITDVLMPDGVGPELADRLQADYPELLVLFTSGYPEATFDPAKLAASGRYFLPKPFTPLELLSVVARILSVLEPRLEAGALERALES